MLESTEVLKLRGDKNRWPCIVANEEFSIKLKQKLTLIKLPLLFSCNIPYNELLRYKEFLHKNTKHAIKILKHSLTFLFIRKLYYQQ